MLGSPPQKDTAGVVQFLQYVRWANQVLGHPKGRGLPTSVTSSSSKLHGGNASSRQQHRNSGGVMSLSDLLTTARTCCDALSNGRILLSLLRKLIASTSDMGGSRTASTTGSLNTSTESTTASGGVSNVLANLIEVRRICMEIVLPECGIDTASQPPLPTPEKLYSGNFESHCVLLHSIFYAFVVRVRLGSQVSPHRHHHAPSSSSSPTVDANAMLRSYRTVATCFQMPLPLYTTNQSTVLENTIVDNFADGSLLLLTIYTKQLQRKRHDVVTSSSSKSTTTKRGDEEMMMTAGVTDPSRIHLDAPVSSQERLHNWVYLFTVLEELGLHNYFRGYLLPTAPIYSPIHPPRPEVGTTTTSASSATAQEVHLAATTTSSATFLFMQAFYIFQVLGGVEDRETIDVAPIVISPADLLTTSKKDVATMSPPHHATSLIMDCNDDGVEVVCVQMTPTLSRSASCGGTGKAVAASASSRGASVISAAPTPSATTPNTSPEMNPAAAGVSTSSVSNMNMSVSGTSRGPSVRTILSPPTPPRSVSAASSSILPHGGGSSTNYHHHNHDDRSSSGVNNHHTPPTPPPQNQHQQPSGFIPVVAEDTTTVTSPFMDAALRRMRCGISGGPSSYSYATVYDIIQQVDDAPASRSRSMTLKPAGTTTTATSFQGGGTTYRGAADGYDDNDNRGGGDSQATPYVVDLHDDMHHHHRSMSMSNQSVGSRSAYSVQLPPMSGESQTDHRQQQGTPLSSYSISHTGLTAGNDRPTTSSFSHQNRRNHQQPTRITTTSEPVVILDISAITTSDEDDGLVSVADLNGNTTRLSHPHHSVVVEDIDHRHHITMSAMASMRLPTTAITPASPPPRTVRSLGGMGGGLGDVVGSPSNDISSVSRNLVPIASINNNNSSRGNGLVTSYNSINRHDDVTAAATSTSSATHTGRGSVGGGGSGDVTVLPYMYLPPPTAWDAASDSDVQKVAYPPPFSSPQKSGIYDATNKSGTPLERFIQYQQEEICRPLNLSHPIVSKGLVKCSSLEVRAYDNSSGGGGGGGARVLTWVSSNAVSTTQLGKSSPSTTTTASTNYSPSITTVSTVVDGRSGGDGDVSDVRVMAVAPRTLWGREASSSVTSKSGSTDPNLSVYSPSPNSSTRGLITQGRYYVPITRISLHELISLNPQLFSASIGDDSDEGHHGGSDGGEGVRGAPCHGCYLLRLPISLVAGGGGGGVGNNTKLPQPFQSLLLQGTGTNADYDGGGTASVYITFVFPTFTSARMCFGAIEREIRYYH